MMRLLVAAYVYLTVARANTFCSLPLFEKSAKYFRFGTKDLENDLRDQLEPLILDLPSDERF